MVSPARRLSVTPPLLTPPAGFFASYRKAAAFLPLLMIKSVLFDELSIAVLRLQVDPVPLLHGGLSPSCSFTAAYVYRAFPHLALASPRRPRRASCRMSAPHPALPRLITARQPYVQLAPLRRLAPCACGALGPELGHHTRATWLHLRRAKGSGQRRNTRPAAPLRHAAGGQPSSIGPCGSGAAQPSPAP